MLKSRKLIIAYHSLHKTENSERRPQEYVSRSQSLPVRLFEGHLRWLNTFAEFVRLDKIISSQPTDHWQIAVTFDDGYYDNIELGLPLFRRYQVPVTWFVCTRYVQNSNRLPWWDLIGYVARYYRNTLDVTTLKWQRTYDLTLSKDRREFKREVREAFLNSSLENRERLYSQIASLCRGIVKETRNAFADKESIRRAAESPWITIGGHTVSHPNLSVETNETVESELKRGRHLLQSWTGQPVKWFAYPYGRTEHYNDGVRRCVEESGFHGAVTTERGYVDDVQNRFEVPRFMVPTYGGMSSFRLGVLALNQVDWFMQKAGRTVHWFRSALSTR